MDPLSEVLSLLKPKSYVSSGFEAGGDWSIQFGDQNKMIKCYAVTSGRCWLAVDNLSDSVELVDGDCFVLPSGRPFRLASDLDLDAIEAAAIFPSARAGGVVTVNGGGDFSLVGSRFAVSGAHAGILMGMLPPVVHIRRQADQEALRWSVHRMMQELRERQPGSFLIAQHLAHMMLVQALRLHVIGGARGSAGWLYGLADKQLGLAIHAVHGDPAQRWTLQQLAGIAHMSRSAFAQKFKITIGMSPMEYVTRWRMLLAADMLETTGDNVSTIATSLGYESESAFSTAFKRMMGCPPSRYSQTMQA